MDREAGAVGADGKDQAIGQEASSEVRQEGGWLQQFSELFDASCMESLDQVTDQLYLTLFLGTEEAGASVTGRIH